MKTRVPLRPEVAAKVARFRAHWRWFAAIGQVDLIRQQSGQAYLVREVQREIGYAMRPEYGDPYRPVYGGPAPGAKTHPTVPQPWLALREGHPAATPGELALAWLAREFGPGQKEGTR